MKYNHALRQYELLGSLTVRFSFKRNIIILLEVFKYNPVGRNPARVKETIMRF